MPEMELFNGRVVLNSSTQGGTEMKNLFTLLKVLCTAAMFAGLMATVAVAGYLASKSEHKKITIPVAVVTSSIFVLEMIDFSLHDNFFGNLMVAVWGTSLACILFLMVLNLQKVREGSKK